MKSVLLADDLTFSRTIIARAIQSFEACVIIEVESGEQAIEVIQSGRELDLIVADLMMPQPNGLELLKLVRTGKTPLPCNFPFIVFSGALTDQVRDALSALDVSAALPKPATKDDWTSVLARVNTKNPLGGKILRPISEYDAVEISGLLDASAFDQAPQDNLTTNPEALVKFLDGAPILEDLDKSELELLSRHAAMVYYPGNEVVDANVYGTAKLPLISKGEAVFLQSSQLPDGEIVEHRVAQLEAGNALGTFNFMSPPKGFVHPKVRTTRPTEVVVLDFDDPDPKSRMSQIRTKVQLTVGRILEQRVTNVDKNLALTLTRQLAETRVKRTAGGYVIMMFVLLAIYTMAMRFLLDVELTGSARTISSVAMIVTFLMPFVIILKNGPIKASDLGLTLRGAWPATIEAIIASSIFIAALAVLKLYIISTVPAYQDQPMFALSRDFTRFIPAGGIDWPFYATNVFIYALFVPVQEVIARCGIQSLLVEFLYGSAGRRAFIAIVVSNFVFAAAHTHLNVGFALATFVGGLFFGWLFHRHRSIIGVSVAHFMVGGAALFALGLEEFLR